MTRLTHRLLLFVCVAVSRSVAGKPARPLGRQPPVEAQCCSDSRQIADVFSAPGHLYGPSNSSIRDDPAAYDFEEIYAPNPNKPLTAINNAAFDLSLRFDFCLDGKAVEYVTVSQNSYFTFDTEEGRESTDLSASSPGTPTLFIGGGDTTAIFIGRRDVVENNLPAVVVRFEGILEVASNAIPTPTIIWEATFYPQNTVRVSSGIDIRGPGSTDFQSGLSNGCGAWKVEGLWAPGEAWLYSNNIGCPTGCLEEEESESDTSDGRDGDGNGFKPDNSDTDSSNLEESDSDDGPSLPRWLLQSADLHPGCDIGMDWADIIRLAVESDSEYIETGGLGSLMEVDVVENWVCVKNDPCALDDWFCYVYVEDSSLLPTTGPFAAGFVPWGPRGCIEDSNL